MISPLRGPSSGPGRGSTAPSSSPRGIESLLARALQEGDEGALRLAVERLRPEMLRLAEGYLRSRDDAEDVVQDSWLAALRGIARFEGRSSLKTWLLRILVYRARTAGRRAGRLVSWDLASLSAEPALVSPLPGPDEALLAQEVYSRVEAAVDDLPTRQGEVVRLRDLEGWSPVEVCDRLQISAGNQRVLLHRGRLQLRQRLTTG